MRLTRPAVLRAALDLLNEVGVDGLTTRRLAERLGVQSPTLYWHFRNKRELLDAMAAEMLAERHEQSLPGRGEDWRKWLLDNARSFRHALLAYRDGARIHAGTQPRAGELDSVEAKLRFLCAAGFDPAEALPALIALGRFVVGWVLEEQADTEIAREAGDRALLPSAAEHPLLAEGLGRYRGKSGDAAFDHAIGIFIAGLAPSAEPGG